MKALCIITVVSASLYGCAPNRYLLTDDGDDKYYLANYIRTAAKKGEISRHPIVFVNALPFTYEMLKERKLYISKSSIKQIVKLSDEETQKRYGSLPKDGTLQVTTYPSVTLSRYGNSLILLDDKKISVEELDKLDMDKIESISISKGVDQVKKLTTENYDNVIVLRTKKG